MKNLLPVVNELDERGWTNKLWHSKKGLPKGGRAFDKSSLLALLTNPIYCGKIKHKSDLYQGQHQAIVDQDIFDRVQAQLRENGFNRGNRLPSKNGIMGHRSRTMSRNHQGQREIIRTKGNHQGQREIIRDKGNHQGQREIIRTKGNHQVRKSSGTHVVICAGTVLTDFPSIIQIFG